jgi:SAM-dependent methyltransferase
VTDRPIRYVADAASPAAQRERDWWDTHTSDEFVWGADGDGVAACCALIAAGLHIEPGHEIFDLGCGPGRLLVPMGRAYPEVAFTGFDSSQAMIHRAWSGCYSPTRKAELTDGRSIPAGNESFDGGWCVLVFQHIDTLTQYGYISEVARVLKPGGRFVVQVDASPTPEHGDAFLSHTTDVDRLADWGVGVGLDTVDVLTGEKAWQHGQPGVFEQWAWIYLQKEN